MTQPKKPFLIPVALREELIDRLEVASFVGSLVIDEPTLAAVLWALFPEDFRPPPAPPGATQTACRSASRIDAYAERASAGRHIYHPDDAVADGAGRGLRTTWTNGTGAIVHGWDGEPGDDDGED